MQNDPKDLQKAQNQIKLLNSCNSLMFTIGCLLPLAVIGIIILLSVAGVFK